MNKWNKITNGIASTNGYEVMARPAPAKKNRGHDVYHRNPTRRVWVGFAESQAAGKALADTGILPSRKARKR